MLLALPLSQSSQVFQVYLSLCAPNPAFSPPFSTTSFNYVHCSWRSLFRISSVNSHLCSFQLNVNVDFCRCCLLSFENLLALRWPQCYTVLSLLLMSIILLAMAWHLGRCCLPMISFVTHARSSLPPYVAVSTDSSQCLYTRPHSKTSDILVCHIRACVYTCNL
ncbi:hypothetical protein F4604DRAFT_1831895 [Suillus subluteus]|nr:hypothetical protein F4604DRAFT_1831895 [Suillus subluteus]